MLPIGTTEFAQRLYATWRDGISMKKVGVWQLPEWDLLSRHEQEVWKDVARSAGKAVDDAMNFVDNSGGGQ